MPPVAADHAGGAPREAARGGGRADAGAFPYWPRILRRDLAARYLGLSPGTFDAAARDAGFPRPVPVVGTVKGWDRHDLDDWIEARKAVQEQTPNPWDDL